MAAHVRMAAGTSSRNGRTCVRITQSNAFVGMPAPVVETLSKQILAAFDTPRVKQLHDTFGIPDKPTTPAEFVRLFRDDGPVWIAMTKELGLTLD